MVTLALIYFSYQINFLRIGIVVLLCHDLSDVFLELAKILNYLQFAKATDACFTIFAIVFFTVSALLQQGEWERSEIEHTGTLAGVLLLSHSVSDFFYDSKRFLSVQLLFLFFQFRLVFFPWRAVYAAVYYGYTQLGWWNGYITFISLLFILQGLHIFWFSIILKMIAAFVKEGEVKKDAREDSDEDTEEDMRMTQQKDEDKAAAQLAQSSQQEAEAEEEEQDDDKPTQRVTRSSAKKKSKRAD